MDDLVATHIAGIVPYAPGKPIEELERELGFAPGFTVKLASNENPLGPSPRALKALHTAAVAAHRYPDGSAFALRQALAAHHAVSMAEVVVGCGSNDLINLLALVFVGPDDEALISDTSFLCYELACRAAGAAFRTAPLRNSIVDLAALAAMATAGTKLVFLGNPNNPTGTYFTRAALEEFFARLPPRAIVVIDEAYHEYADAPDYPDTLSYRARRPRLVVLRTFSKVHGLAGLRVGYAIAEPEIAQYLNRVRAPFNVSSVAQAAALAALDDAGHVRRSRQMNCAERARLTHELPRLGIGVTPSQANFMLAQMPRPAGEVYEALLRLGIIVRPVANYGLPRHLRITVGTPAQNTRLLQALATVLA